MGQGYSVKSKVTVKCVSLNLQVCLIRKLVRQIKDCKENRYLITVSGLKTIEISQMLDTLANSIYSQYGSEKCCIVSALCIGRYLFAQVKLACDNDVSCDHNMHIPQQHQSYPSNYKAHLATIEPNTCIPLSLIIGGMCLKCMVLLHQVCPV